MCQLPKLRAIRTPRRIAVLSLASLLFAESALAISIDTLCKCHVSELISYSDGTSSASSLHYYPWLEDFDAKPEACPDLNVTQEPIRYWDAGLHVFVAHEMVKTCSYAQVDVVRKTVDCHTKATEALKVDGVTKKVSTAVDLRSGVQSSNCQDVDIAFVTTLVEKVGDKFVRTERTRVNLGSLEPFETPAPSPTPVSR